ncbi:MAG: RdgB/HAM1 family non-canonical purine NTP pyrophosphatase [Bythopirellula sp.]|nr:RdgB/HAM1 family non-canonical purine NTP pyrophosphatase [Bythopirellula sp.]
MKPNSHQLILGTTNSHKGRELAQLLEPFGFEIRTLKDFPNALDVVEDGDSFAANARLKASKQAQHLRAWVLADDSGLEVAALGGAPGIYSARYAGTGGDSDNNAKLLNELTNVPWEKRDARYYCHVALADPIGAIRAESSGICGGRIRTTGSGTNGFGYDPLFEVCEYHQTFGELGPQVKAALSHRARAMRAILPQLLAIVAAGEWH